MVRGLSGVQVLLVAGLGASDSRTVADRRAGLRVRPVRRPPRAPHLLGPRTQQAALCCIKLIFVNTSVIAYLRGNDDGIRRLSLIHI